MIKKIHLTLHDESEPYDLHTEFFTVPVHEIEKTRCQDNIYYDFYNYGCKQSRKNKQLDSFQVIGVPEKKGLYEVSWI